MPTYELPPEPPEGHTLRFVLNLLAYLSAFRKKKNEADSLLFAPVGTSGYKSIDQISIDMKAMLGHTPVDIVEMYQLIRDALIHDMERWDRPLYDMLLEKRMRNTKNRDKQAWTTLLGLVAYPPKDIQEMRAQRTEPIHDAAFSKKTGYTTVLRGMGGDVLFLSGAEDAEKPAPHPLALGMIVPYKKIRGPLDDDHPLARMSSVEKPDTGPLDGMGKIIHISIPKIGAVSDRVITLLVDDKKGTTKTFLTIEDLLLD
ncbi:hypothetical protein HY732_03900 [Candidatus Uhrbacteria bacterium]|nr:hypothetical protein [Candidatus Uhrbacteria bacterium]